MTLKPGDLVTLYMYIPHGSMALWEKPYFGLRGHAHGSALANRHSAYIQPRSIAVVIGHEYDTEMDQSTLVVCGNTYGWIVDEFVTVA